jgi:hypothetical protein
VRWAKRYARHPRDAHGSSANFELHNPDYQLPIPGQHLGSANEVPQVLLSVFEKALIMAGSSQEAFAEKYCDAFVIPAVPYLEISTLAQD